MKGKKKRMIEAKRVLAFKGFEVYSMFEKEQYLAWGGTQVRFSRTPDEAFDVPADVRIPYADWVDLGSPETMTLTIRPGDELNEKVSK